MKLAIQKYWKNFAAVVALAVLGLFAAGYIMGHQRFYLPAWVPVLGTDFVDYKANFSTAQSVTPGQGQTVQIAGVDVGDISKVDLVNGQAQITMKLRKKYTPIHTDATALLRPKTGLNDMIVAARPGHGQGAEGARGLGHPDRPHAPEHQRRRGAVRARRRHPRLPPAPRRRCRPDLRGEQQAGLGDVQALRAARARPRAPQRRAVPAPAGHRPLRPQLPAAGRRARRQGQPARDARRLVQPRVPLLRPAGREPQGDAARAADHAAVHGHRAGQDRQVREGARPDARRPAAGGARARPVAAADPARSCARPRRSSTTSCGPSRSTCSPS